MKTGKETMYADDITVTYSSKNPDDLQHVVNEELVCFGPLKYARNFVQNNGLVAFVGLVAYQTLTSPIFLLLNGLGYHSVKNMIHEETPTTAYNSRNSLTPEYRSDLFERDSSVYYGKIRNSETNLGILLMRTAVGQKLPHIQEIAFG